jgi:hypothetical protein
LWIGILPVSQTKERIKKSQFILGILAQVPKIQQLMAPFLVPANDSMENPVSWKMREPKTRDSPTAVQLSSTGPDRWGFVRAAALEILRVARDSSRANPARTEQ